MSALFSPLFISVALHYYYSPVGVEVWTDSGFADSEVLRECVQRLCNAGLLRKEVDGHVKTRGLDVYVERLMAVPLPKQKMVWD
jgi:hypothetical protein